MKTHWFSLTLGFWDMTLEAVWFPWVSPVLIFLNRYMCVCVCVFMFVCFLVLLSSDTTLPWKLTKTMNLEKASLIHYNLIYPGAISRWPRVFFPHLRDQRKWFLFQAGSSAMLSSKESSQKNHILPLSVFSCSVLRHFYQAYQEKIQLNFTHVRKSLSEGW